MIIKHIKSFKKIKKATTLVLSISIMSSVVQPSLLHAGLGDYFGKIKTALSVQNIKNLFRPVVDKTVRIGKKVGTKPVVHKMPKTKTFFKKLVLPVASVLAVGSGALAYKFVSSKLTKKKQASAGFFGWASKKLSVKRLFGSALFTASIGGAFLLRKLFLKNKNKDNGDGNKGSKKNKIDINKININVENKKKKDEKGKGDDKKNAGATQIQPVAQEDAQEVIKFLINGFAIDTEEKIGEFEAPKPLTIPNGKKENGYIEISHELGNLEISDLYVPQKFAETELSKNLLKCAFMQGKKMGATFVTVEASNRSQAYFFEQFGFKIESVKNFGANEKYYLKKETLDFVEPQKFTHEFTGKLKSKPQDFMLMLKKKNEIIGAIVCDVNANTQKVHIGGLIVKKEHRGCGYGKKLLNEALAQAKQKNCKFASLETFSFQVPGFYKKLGFTENFIRKGYKKDIKVHFFSKKI